jgi:GxxExxY protein
MLVYEELSNKILEAYFNVLKHLTTGLLESVYENALCIEFDEMAIPYERQKRLSIYYKGRNIGDFIPDIVVDNKIILELKSIPELTAANTAQLINYLNITQMKVGYLLNFGERRDYKRILNKQKSVPVR